MSGWPLFGEFTRQAPPEWLRARGQASAKTRQARAAQLRLPLPKGALRKSAAGPRLRREDEDEDEDEGEVCVVCLLPVGRCGSAGACARVLEDADVADALRRSVGRGRAP